MMNSMLTQILEQDARARCMYNVQVWGVGFHIEFFGIFAEHIIMW